jgi:hypothetical protein
MESILAKLRETDVEKRVGEVDREASRRSLDEFLASGVKFVSSHPKIENVYYRAVHDLMNCIHPSVTGSPMLIEGAVFIGCWLESTGTISTELLSRFCPETAQACFELFADFIREDGLIPYKLTDAGPSYRQIQMVTPLARSVWNHYRLHRDKRFLEKMYEAMARNDAWLAANRDTRGTGCVEAFCTFDTGHDASPRFWHAPDVPYMADPARCDPDSPILPFLAPDLTANVYCQRKYLQRMADELGGSDKWDEKAKQSLDSLMKYCYDGRDRCFYDRDRHGRFVRLQSDVLMRVFACEAGSDEMFEDALRRYLLNTKKFFSRYPLTTIAMDDPGFFQSIGYNSWSGHVSFLTEIRLPHAFEYHRRYVELNWILHPVITALSRLKQFAGSICPWIGCEGYSENYSPTMLCVLDYLERYCGIFPTPAGELWFTAMVPRGIDYGEIVAEETGYARTVDGACFEFVNGREASEAYKNSELLYRLPQGIRLVTDREGNLTGLIGMTARTIRDEIRYRGKAIPFTISGNERLEFSGNGFVSVENPGVVPPCFEPPEP